MTGAGRERRLRVLYYYWSLAFDTGSPKVLVSMIDALDRSRVAPLFWATGEGPLVAQLARRDVELIRGPAGDVSWRRPFEAAGRVIGKMRALRRARVDLLHINEFGWNQDLAIAAWLLRIPVVLHVHNRLVVDGQNLHRFIASAVLFVSQAHMDQTVNLERIASRARVLHNPIDVGYYASGRSRRAELGLAESDVVVLGIGQLVPRKGLDVLIEAARRLLPADPDLRFVVAGPEKDEHEEHAQELLESAADPRLDGRFQFLGSRADVPDLLASADIFALPTRDEPFGLVIAEAMAASLPVVATRIGGIPEVLGDSGAGVLLEPDDVDGFTREIGRLAASAAERRERGGRGRPQVEREFGSAGFGERLARLYDEVTR